MAWHEQLYRLRLTLVVPSGFMFEIDFMLDCTAFNLHASAASWALCLVHLPPQGNTQYVWLNSAMSIISWSSRLHKFCNLFIFIEWGYKKTFFLEKKKHVAFQYETGDEVITMLDPVFSSSMLFGFNLLYTI